MDDDKKTTQELCDELQKLIDKYAPADGGEDGGDAEPPEPTEQDAERMSELTAIIEKRRAAGQTRAARIAAARAAIESGTARTVASVPLGDSATARGSIGCVRDVTDYARFERSAWVKDLARRSGIQLIDGVDLTSNERAALAQLHQRASFTHLTGNTDAVVPVEVQNQIISLIDGTAVLFGDIKKTNFKNQFELIRHKSIDKGDAAATAEGAAPADDEQNTFDNVTLTGEEIKKTVKLSRKMAVQSVEGFEQYIVTETAARLAVAANAAVHARTVDATLGMAATNKISVAKAGTLTKADMVKLLSLLYTYGNPAPKGCIIYANNNTIWNQIAMLEDANKRSYFVNEKTDDPSVEGIIFGKYVKRDDSMADGVIKAGYPELIHGNIFDGVDVTPYVEPGTQQRCFDGYLLFDCGVAVPQAWAQLTITTASAGA